jgi:hypothetical protein
MSVAALYVETGGCYYGLPDVDPWDEERDARLYAGPWSVVAHPPCNRWSIMANCNPHIRHLLGQDGGCFEHALRTVRDFGGVLEHPASTAAWAKFNLPKPKSRGGWTQSLLDPGWSCMVDQAAYGHDCHKPTWLYYVGPEPPDLDWSGWKRGEQTVRGLGNGLSSPTPIAFRDVLLDMARSAGRVTA